METPLKGRRISVRVSDETAQKLEQKALQNNMKLSTYINSILEGKAVGETWEYAPHISREIVSDTKMINSMMWCFLKANFGDEKARQLLEDSKKLPADNLHVMIENIGK